ncbi:MAG: hypothetical protein H7Y86_00740 [Rhizobacter sp.]|nr:hypothetical protein [Ferruginibacter sp.]
MQQKIIGRTQKGLGVGILNAVTNSQFAKIENNVSGENRKFKTEPLTNYNVFVFDQRMKNNSSISLVNTNVLGEGAARDAQQNGHNKRRGHLLLPQRIFKFNQFPLLVKPFYY